MATTLILVRSSRTATENPASFVSLASIVSDASMTLIFFAQRITNHILEQNSLNAQELTEPRGSPSTPGSQMLDIVFHPVSQSFRGHV